MATEATVKELRDRSASAQAKYEADVSQLQEELEGCRKELEKRRQDSLEFVKEVENTRADLAAAAKSHTEEVALLKAAAERAEAAALQSAEQVGTYLPTYLHTYIP